MCTLKVAIDHRDSREVRTQSRFRARTEVMASQHVYQARIMWSVAAAAIAITSTFAVQLYGLKKGALLLGRVSGPLVHSHA